MGVWKRDRVYNWELMFGVSFLVLGFVTMGALLAYHSFLHAGGAR